MDQEIIQSQTPAEIQDDIVFAALKLFARQGYFTTSLSDIAKEAGLTNASAVYQHFKNKQIIATELYAKIFDTLNVSIDDIRRRNPKASDQLHGVVDLFFKLSDEAPDIMRFILLLNINEFLPVEKPLLDTPAFVKINKIIQSGIKAGEIRNLDPQLAYAYFFGTVNHTLRLVLDRSLDKKADAYLPQTWLAAWTMIAKK